MVRSLLRSLRQPRYAALTVLMIVVAAVCVAAGTWQVARLQGKAAHNAELRRNAHAPAARVAEVLPLVGRAPTPNKYAVDFRRVTVSGTFDASHQSLVRQRSVNDDNGFLVLTPLRTADGTLLVVRGFIPQAGTQRAPAIPAPPSTPVQALARVHPGESRHDQAAVLSGGQVDSINPAEQQARLSTPVFDGYAVLEPGQPGVESLVAVPEPDLSNPAGGAVEPQHIAYVIQWFLFALLALAAPVAMVRAETRQHHLGDIDDQVAATLSPEPTAAEEAAEPTPEQLRAAKLADRYGRTR